MSRTRVSRGLVAAVGVVIVLGAVAYLHNTNKRNANDKSNGWLPGRDRRRPPTPRPDCAAPKPAQAAAPAPAVSHNGQIALPGTGHADRSRRRPARAPKRLPSSPVQTSERRTPSEAESAATQTAGPIASAKPVTPVAAAETPAGFRRPPGQRTGRRQGQD